MMALVRDEMGRCKNCARYGLMQFVNHKQSQLYCNLCKPVVEQREIDNAIRVLISKGVTVEMFERFLASQKESPSGQT